MPYCTYNNLHTLSANLYLRWKKTGQADSQDIIYEVSTLGENKSA